MPRFLALILPVVLLAGCSREAATPPPATVAEPVVVAAAAAPAVSGEAVYAAHCAQCHEGQALRAPHRTIAGLMAPHRIVAALESGVMMEQGKGLSEAERRAVAEFLTGTPYSPPQPLDAALFCPAGQGGFDADALPDVSGWGVDPGNSHFYQAFNRNKKSVRLDLKQEAGRDVLHKLLEHADAVFNNLRGDLPAKLGLTYDALKHIRKDIVCVHL